MYTQATPGQIEARRQSWQVGLVSDWYLRPSQKDLYNLLLRERYPFIEAARRFGKTTSILSFIFEQLRLNPGWIARWCFPFKNQAREVLSAEIEKMQALCPEPLKFKYQTTHSVYLGPNYGTAKNPIQSKLYIRGVNEDRGESARGPASNIIVCDEYGFWNEPDYIVREVLFPQLEKQAGQWLIKASTPPRNLGHRYYIEREDAIRKNRFIQKTIYDNEALSEQEIQEIIDECGGPNAPAFLRERMCQPVSDPDMLIVPEWSDEENIVEDDYPRPDFFTPYIGGDSGADDNTAVLFGYYDFIKNEKVIERELVINGKTTGEIISACKVIEAELWGGLKAHRRVYDASKQLVFDIYKDHSWPVEMPQKDDKLAAIHDLRVEVGKRKFKVKRSCVNTTRQLKVGMWRDEKHLDFERTEGLGHLDAVAAAIYFNRCIDKKLNPIPRNLGIDYQTHLIPVESVSRTETEKALESLFNPLKRF